MKILILSLLILTATFTEVWGLDKKSDEVHWNNFLHLLQELKVSTNEERDRHLLISISYEINSISTTSDGLLGKKEYQTPKKSHNSLMSVWRMLAFMHYLFDDKFDHEIPLGKHFERYLINKIKKHLMNLIDNSFTKPKIKWDNAEIIQKLIGIPYEYKNLQLAINIIEALNHICPDFSKAKLNEEELVYYQRIIFQAIIMTSEALNNIQTYLNDLKPEEDAIKFLNPIKDLRIIFLHPETAREELLLWEIEKHPELRTILFNLLNDLNLIAKQIKNRQSKLENLLDYECDFYEYWMEDDEYNGIEMEMDDVLGGIFFQNTFKEDEGKKFEEIPGLGFLTIYLKPDRKWEVALSKCKLSLEKLMNGLSNPYEVDEVKKRDLLDECNRLHRCIEVLKEFNFEIILEDDAEKKDIMNRAIEFLTGIKDNPFESLKGIISVSKLSDSAKRSLDSLNLSLEKCAQRLDPNCIDEIKKWMRLFSKGQAKEIKSSGEITLKICKSLYNKYSQYEKQLKYLNETLLALGDYDIDQLRFERLRELFKNAETILNPPEDISFSEDDKKEMEKQIENKCKQIESMVKYEWPSQQEELLNEHDCLKEILSLKDLLGELFYGYSLRGIYESTGQAKLSHPELLSHHLERHIDKSLYVRHLISELKLLLDKLTGKNRPGFFNFNDLNSNLKKYLEQSLRSQRNFNEHDLWHDNLRELACLVALMRSHLFLPDLELEISKNVEVQNAIASKIKDLSRKIINNTISIEDIKNAKEEGVDLNAFDGDAGSKGKTLLHQAILARNADIVEVLLKFHADPNLPDQAGNYPLHMAASLVPDQTTRPYQYQHERLNLDQLSYLNEAIEQKDYIIVKNLDQQDIIIGILEHAGAVNDVININGQTPAQVAFQKGNLQVADRLNSDGFEGKGGPARKIFKGLSLGLPYEDLVDRNTPKFLMSSEGHTFLGTAIQNMRIEDMPKTLEMLIEEGADIYQKDCHGKTPIDYFYLRADKDEAIKVLKKGEIEYVDSAKERIIQNGWYEDPEMAMLLTLRLQEVNMNFLQDPTYEILAPLGGTESGNQVTTQLRAIESRRNGAQRTILLPYNISNRHWVAVVIHVPSEGEVTVDYYDSLQGEMPEYLMEEIQNVYKTAKQNKAPGELYTQNDDYNCGPCTVENLILAARRAASPENDVAAESTPAGFRAIHAALIQRLGPQNRADEIESGANVIAIEELKDSLYEFSANGIKWLMANLLYKIQSHRILIY